MPTTPTSVSPDSFFASLPKPIGVQAKAPMANLKAPANKLPAGQQAPATVKDLSGNYANVNGTIYNKTNNTGFSKPEDFFKESGQTDFKNVKFDTAWKPPTPPSPTPSATPAAPSAPPVVSTATNGATPAKIPDAPYTPPNQGTTGVNQGGIVGNLLGIAAKESPQVTKARENLQKLQEDDAQASADINSRPEGLTQQTGQQGILAQLFAAKQGAAQTALSSALTSQGQQINATQAAGGLNAPIVTTPGAAVVSPTNPDNGTIVGGNSTLNPLSQITPLAQQVVNGTKSFSDALAAGGNVPNFNSALSAEITKLSPGFNFNTAQGASQGQQTNALTAATAGVNANAAAYAASVPAVDNLNRQINNVGNLGDLTLKTGQQYGINPTDAAPLNNVIQNIRTTFSDAGALAFQSNVAQLESAITGFYSANGTPTQQSSIANKLADPNLSMAGLSALITQAKNEGAILLKNQVATAVQQYQQTQGGANNSTSTGGGGLFDW